MPSADLNIDTKPVTVSAPVDWHSMWVQIHPILFNFPVWHKTTVARENSVYTTTKSSLGLLQFGQVWHRVDSLTLRVGNPIKVRQPGQG